MGVGAIGSNSLLDSASLVGQSGPLQGIQDRDGDAAQVSGAGTGGAPVQISPFGDLFQKLSALEQTDPAKAKALLTQAASRLQQAAGQTTGHQSQFLTSLANRFTAAAQTGDLSQLRPPQQGQGAAGAYQNAAGNPADLLQSPGQAQGAQGHHHHHHHGGSGGQGGSSSGGSGGSDLRSVLGSVFQQLEAGLQGATSDASGQGGSGAVSSA